VERDVGLQLEGVRHAVLGRGPGLGEQRCGVGRAGLGADETLEDLARDAEGLAVLSERGVEVGGIGRSREDERAVDVGCLAGVTAAVALTGAGGQDERPDGDRRGAREQAPLRSVEHVLCTFHVVGAPLHVFKAQRCGRPSGGVMKRRYPDETHSTITPVSRLCFDGAFRHRSIDLRSGPAAGRAEPSASRPAEAHED
jgi:hypothetical protein